MDEELAHISDEFSGIREPWQISSRALRWEKREQSSRTPDGLHFAVIQEEEADQNEAGGPEPRHSVAHFIFGGETKL
jgi:hypothetical protein